MKVEFFTEKVDGKDADFIRVSFPPSEERTIVAPVDAECRADGGGQTYAERFAKEYRDFKSPPEAEEPKPAKKAPAKKTTSRKKA